MTVVTPTPAPSGHRLEIPRTLSGMQYRRARFEQVEDTDERVITLRAVPYDIETQLADQLVESFEPGAFARAAKDPARVKLWHGHSTTGGQIVGQAFEIDDQPEGPLIRSKVSRTPAGDELLTLAADGVLDEASIEFNPIRDAMRIERRGDVLHVRHLRAHLRGVALVPYGQYGRDALVASVRDDDDKAAEAAYAARQAAIERLHALQG